MIIEYDSFNNETKSVINLAMRIYATIEKWNIVKDKVYECKKPIINYALTRIDKKVISLYLACFLADTKLKSVLEEYEDISAKSLLNFINLKEEDIVELDIHKCKRIYENYFMKDLYIKVIDKRTKDKITFDAIYPETLYYLLGGNSFNNSNILNYFISSIDKNMWFIGKHPSFKMIKKVLLMNKHINKFEDVKVSSVLMDVYTKAEESSVNIKPSPAKNTRVVNIWDILDDIKDKFIGQENTVEHLFYNLVNNQQLAKRSDVQDGERSLIFIDGPTGTGKTAITREITERLNIPMTISSITNYSSTGYVGGNITDTLQQLLRISKGNLANAERGIIVFDEFDKIAYDKYNGLEMKKAVQQQLLDFMGGGKYQFKVEDSSYNERTVNFNTSKITFICLGALSDLRDNKVKPKRAIGFSDDKPKETIEENNKYSIKPQDLINLGLEKELVGRFNTYLHTDEYNSETLEKILRKSTISPIESFKKWVNSYGKELIIDDKIYGTIANMAYELHTGARGLQTVVNNIRTHYIKEVLRGSEKTITLSDEKIKEINDYTYNRLGM